MHSIYNLFPSTWIKLQAIYSTIQTQTLTLYGTARADTAIPICSSSITSSISSILELQTTDISITMSHLSDLPGVPLASATSGKKRLWLSRLWNKLFGKVFRLKRTYSMPAGSYDHYLEDYYYRGYQSLSGRTLSSIPEVSEESPDIAPVVRKVQSERLTGTDIVELEMVL